MGRTTSTPASNALRTNSRSCFKSLIPLTRMPDATGRFKRVWPYANSAANVSALLKLRDFAAECGLPLVGPELHEKFDQRFTTSCKRIRGLLCHGQQAMEDRTASCATLSPYLTAVCLHDG